MRHFIFTFTLLCSVSLSVFSQDRMHTKVISLRPVSETTTVLETNSSSGVLLEKTVSTSSSGHLLQKTGATSSASSVPVLPDNLDVSGGTLRYSIPIASPSGINGLSPGIALSYNSNRTNGIAGPGWDISGLSNISRIHRSLQYDDQLNTAGEKDRFALDGERLILSPTSRLEDGIQVYETATHSNRRIVYYNTSLSPDGKRDHFIVYYPNGSKRYYGRYSSTKNGMVWALDKEEDAQGNRITYRYTTSDHTLYISSIKYAYRDYNPDTYAYEIRFGYKDTSEVLNVFYDSGDVYKESRVLEDIEVYGKTDSGTSLYSRYTLHYEDSAVTSNTRLTSVSSNMGGDIQFEYGASARLTTATYDLKTSEEELFPIQLSADLDGDNVADVVSFNESRDAVRVLGSKDNALYNLSDFGGFEHILFERVIVAGHLAPQQAIIFVSKPGDSYKFKTYILSEAGNTLHLLGEGYRTLPEAEEPLEFYSGHFTGHSGDLGETLIIDKEGRSYLLSYNRTAAKPERLETLTYRFPRSYDRRYIIDFDGNGISDVMTLDYKDIVIDSYDASTGIFNRVNETTISEDFRLHDFGIKLGYLKDHFSYYPKKETYAERPLLFGDFNGDGKTDFTYPKAIGESDWYIYYGTGVDFDIKTVTGPVYEPYEYSETNIDDDDLLLHVDEFPPYFFNEHYTFLDLFYAYEGIDPRYFYDTYHQVVSRRHYFLTDYDHDGRSDLMRYTTTIERDNYKARQGYTRFPVLDNFIDYDESTDELITGLGDRQERYSLSQKMMIHYEQTVDLHIRRPDSYMTTRRYDVSVYGLHSNTNDTGGEFRSKTEAPLIADSLLSEKQEPSDIIGDEDFGQFIYPGASEFTEYAGLAGHLRFGYMEGDKLHIHTLRSENLGRRNITRVTNSDLETTISYACLNDGEDSASDVYAFDEGAAYPNINVNISGIDVVSKLERKVLSSGAMQHRDFKYSGAISHADYGFLGFKYLKSTGWYGENTNIFWNISEQDMSNRGVAKADWVATTYHDAPPENNVLTRNTYAYITETQDNGVFINYPDYITRSDRLEGTEVKVSYQYNADYNPTRVLTEDRSPTTSTGPRDAQAVYTRYEDNVISDTHYIVGLPTSIEARNTLDWNTFKSKKTFHYKSNIDVLPEYVLQYASDESAHVKETLTYDRYGHVTSRKLETSDGLPSREESFAYDDSGRFLETHTNALGQEQTYAYDGFGMLEGQTNVHGLETSYTYDAYNRLLSETNYLGHTAHYGYETTSLEGHGLCYLNTVDYPDQPDQRVYKTRLGFEVKTSQMGLNGDWISQSYAYDGLGRPERVSEPYFDDASPTQWRSYAYDDYGRPQQETSHTGRITRTRYDGKATTITIDNGTSTPQKTVTTTRDAFGHVTHLEDDGGEISYRYYGNGAMREAKYEVESDDSTLTVSTEIDAWGRKKTLTDPSAGTYTYAYNTFGEVLEETSPKGTTTYTYDAYGRPTQKIVSGDETNMTLNYTYNADGLLGSMFGYSNGRYDYSYTYDDYKRLTGVLEVNRSNRVQFRQNLSYDTYGRVDTQTYSVPKLGPAFSDTSGFISHGVTVSHGYDAVSGLKHMLKDDSGKTLWQLTDHNARGQAKEIHLGNGIVQNRRYDAYGLFEQIEDVSSGDASVEALHLEYDFDAQRGVLNSRKNAAFGGWEEHFEHDVLNRLTAISGSTEHTQSYDDRGRITSNSHVGDYTYKSDKPYQLEDIALNNQGDLYYQNHNLQEVVYNAYKKPVRIHQEGKGRVDFSYGPLMNRTRAYYGGDQENASERRYFKVYSSIMPVEMVLDREKQSVKITTYIDGDAYTAPVVHIKESGTEAKDDFYYLHRDHLGSILAITDSEGVVKERRQFGAWGSSDKYWDDKGHDTFGHESLLNRGFTGHEHFFGVGLIHMNGRMYDANLGRFLSPDNYIQAPYSTQSYNRYSYVWNNPLVNTDPSGEITLPAYIRRNLGIVFRRRANATRVAHNIMRYGYEAIVKEATRKDGTRGYRVIVPGLPTPSTQTSSPSIIIQQGTTPVSDSSPTPTPNPDDPQGEEDPDDPPGEGEENDQQTNTNQQHDCGAEDGSIDLAALGLTAASVADKSNKILIRNFNGVTSTSVIRMPTPFPNIVVPNKVLKTIKSLGRLTGSFLGVYNASSIESQYENGRINNTERRIEHTSNTISSLGGLYGSAWGIGWELGRTITNIDGYHENVRLPLRRCFGID